LIQLVNNAANGTHTVAIAFSDKFGIAPLVGASHRLSEHDCALAPHIPEEGLSIVKAYLPARQPSSQANIVIKQNTRLARFAKT
jgi:hypothetical protein